VNASAELIATLTAAKTENQFLKAVESVKDAMPQSLLIGGHHNPLTLLHKALSVGLHEQTDTRCLELAHDIRLVLGELAERLSVALKDEAELNAAVVLLLRSEIPTVQFCGKYLLGRHASLIQGHPAVRSDRIFT
jgi:hypothetical protein